MATVELTTENFESVIGDADLALVDFWAAWCGPCRMFGPVFERASEQYPDAVFGKVDTEAQQVLAASFGISSIPTLMIVRENVVVYAQPGALPAAALEELITKARELDMDEVRASIAEHQAADQAGSRLTPPRPGRGADHAKPDDDRRMGGSPSTPRYGLSGPEISAPANLFPAPGVPRMDTPQGIIRESHRETT